MSEIGNIKTLEEKEGIFIKSNQSPFAESFFFIDFFDEKMLSRFIKSTERLIRTSKEYSFYIESLRTNVSVLNQDNIQSNITSNDASLEFHHYPLSLYDLIYAIVCKNIQDNKKINTFRIAKEVMKLHNENKVGLVSLTKTNHELAHDGKLFIKKAQIFGEYKNFIEEYKNGISISILQKVEKMEKESQKNLPSDFSGIYS